jgi:quercetin dioxygenase-like cupin family protein
MKAQPFVVPPNDYSQPLQFVGEQVTVLASGAATQGYEISLQEGPEGSGSPPHAHPMKAQPFVVTPKDYDPALNVLGIQVTVLASNAATQAYEITRQQGEQGMGPPPHSHNWDESFYVVAGDVEFTCAGRTVVCPPGTLVHVPAGTVHSFRYLADGCDVLEFTGQGGNATRMFAHVSREVPPGPPDVPALMSLFQQNGVTLMLG